MPPEMSPVDLVIVTFGLNFVSAAGWVAGACAGLWLGIPLIARAVRKLTD